MSTAGCCTGLIGHLAVDFLTMPGIVSPATIMAVDLKLHVQGPLLSFQLFDFLQAGHWDPRQGIYTLDPAQLAADVMRAYALQQAAQSQQAAFGSLKQVNILKTVRCFVAIESFTQASLRHLPAADFCHRCRLSDICFDMEEGTGASLHIMHPMIGKGLGLFCSSTNLQDCFFRLLEVSELHV